MKRAAKLLGLEDYLKRKPRALSGGQRQRVAMGRAIVREPAAFLMDEPLSNLDAKLRVQTRAEIAKLQSDLGVTTIYVTHDQVEAMTMGDRVAVMRKGELQQVDEPADPLRPAREPLRRRVHRQPGDEHARRDDRAVERRPDAPRSASRRSRSGRDRSSSGRRLKAYAGKPVIIGIRPEDLGGRRARDRTRRPTSVLNGRLELREALGSEIMAHFAIEGRARRDRRDARTRRGRRNESTEAAHQIGVEENEAIIVGRFGAALANRTGRRGHGSRRHTRAALLRPCDRCRNLRRTPTRKETPHEEALAHRGLPRSPFWRLAAFAAHAAGERLEVAHRRALPRSRARSRSTGSGPARRRRPSAR